MYYAVFKDGISCYVGDDGKAAMQAVENNPGCLYETAEKLDEFLDNISKIKEKSLVAPKAGCCKKETIFQGGPCLEGDGPDLTRKNECGSVPLTFADIKQQINEELKANGVEPVDFEDFFGKIKVDGEQFLADVKSYSNKGIVAVGNALVRLGNYFTQFAEPVVVVDDQSNE